MRESELAVLKKIKHSVNTESIYLEKKVEYRTLWLVITKSYFKNNNLLYRRINLEPKVNPTHEFILQTSLRQEESSSMFKSFEKNC